MNLAPSKGEQDVSPNGKKNYKPSWTAEFSYPIEGAVQNNYPEIIHLLDNAGPNVNTDVPGEGYEESPLCIAAREGATETAQALLTHSARTTTIYDTSALAVARRCGHEEIARLIEARTPLETSNPHFPAIQSSPPPTPRLRRSGRLRQAGRSGHPLLQRPSPQKQFPSNLTTALLKSAAECTPTIDTRPWM